MSPERSFLRPCKRCGWDVKQPTTHNNPCKLVFIETVPCKHEFPKRRFLRFFFSNLRHFLEADTNTHTFSIFLTITPPPPPPPPREKNPRLRVTTPRMGENGSVHFPLSVISLPSNSTDNYHNVLADPIASAIPFA